MKIKSVTLLAGTIVSALGLLSSGCDRKSPTALPESNSVKESDVTAQSPQTGAPPAVDVPKVGGEVKGFLPNSRLQIDDPIAVWTTVGLFQSGYSRLSNQDFVSATQELLRLREKVGRGGKINSLVVAARIEETISEEVARRVKLKTLSLKEAEQLVGAYLAPVFDTSQLARLVGYPFKSTENMTVENLLEFASVQSGGEDGLFDDVPESGKETWIVLESNKPIFKVHLICGARRNAAALQAYFIFCERGGDVTRRPLFKHIQEIIPDVLKEPVVISAGLTYGALDAGDVERLINGD